MALPAGTVTLLFSDIEGSTRLLEHLGEGYADVLDEHRRIVRDALAAHGGHEVRTEGDAFFVAFARASDAVRAAVAAQRGLAAGAWPGGVAVRVRMGVHTGEPRVMGWDYVVGMDVHCAARICSAAHAGQLIVSETTERILFRRCGRGIRRAGPWRASSHGPRASVAALTGRRERADSGLSAVECALDNLEHLIDGAQLVGELVAACPDVTIVITSREPTRLAAERLYTVRPVAVPEASAHTTAIELERYASVAMFCDRAGALDPVGLRPTSQADAA
jgi:class 3 adenylate cyclase